MNQMFGRYTVVGQLGRGAMGVVYLATDPVLNRQVAIKTVDVALDDDEEREFLRNRLIRDARAAAVLKHPNIVAIHDVFEDGGRAYLVMEYVQGESLAARLKANPMPDGALILKVLGQIADALDYIHSQGVIHRDIKPANVMLDKAGTAKIMDFGIARIADARTNTPTGMVMGTVEYMAPEQIRGDPLDGRADQFALAVVAYQMMTGSTLFGPHTMATLTYKIVNENPPSPCSRNANLPRGVDYVLARALAKVPSERFSSCCEFVGTLGQALFGAPTVPTVASPAVAAAEPARRSRSGIVAAAIAVVGVGGALALWRPWTRTPPPPETVSVVKRAPETMTPSIPSPEPEVPKSVAPPKSEPIHSPPPKVVSTPPNEVAKLPAVAPDPRHADPRPVDPPKAVTPPPVVPKVEPPKPVEPTEPREETEVLPPPPPPKPGKDSTPFDKALQLGHEQMKERNYVDAIQSFTKAIALRPNVAGPYFNRGVAHQNLEHNDIAIRNYSDAIRLDPNMAIAYAARGVCLVRTRRDPDAWSDFQKALELRPNLAAALNGRGGIYFRRRQFRLALADYDAAISNNPRFAQAYLNRARAREAVGDLRGAAADRQTEMELRRR